MQAFTPTDIGTKIVIMQNAKQFTGMLSTFFALDNEEPVRADSSARGG